MTDCIYCTKPLVPGATDGDQPSREHIVQFGIGGSNSLVTWDVHERCNCGLGDTVDADFINLPIIGMACLTHGVGGRNGLREVRLPARSTDTSELGTVVFKPGAPMEVEHKPVVIRDALPGGAEQLLVAGQPEDARRIAEGLLKKAKATGKKISTESGKVVETVGDLLAEAQSEFSHEYKASVGTDPVALMRGYAKIGFAFAHYALGPTWTFSDAADALRTVATGKGSADDINAITRQAKSEIRRLFIANEPAGSHTHLVGIFPGQSNVVVSLFGGTFTYVFDLGVVARTLLDDTTAAGRAAVELDPATRKVRKIGMSDFYAAAVAGRAA